MTKLELVKLLKREFTNKKGIIDLSNLNFGDEYVWLHGMKARVIDSTQLEAKEIIFNNYQIAPKIINRDQKANIIDNDFQEAKEIFNDYQYIGE